jgi:flagellar hook-associated protein 1
MSLLSVGSTGLAAAYAALNTAGHNVANVNTPGYSRQQTVQTTMPGQFSGAGFTGRGVSVQTITRAFDAQAIAQVQFAQAQSSEASVQARLMSQVDRLFAAEDTGMNAAMDRFFSSLTEASARPADLASRTTVIASAGQLVSRFKGAATQMDEMGRNTDLGIRATVSQINTIAKKIGTLNDVIAAAQASGQPPNDLIDQRNEAIRQLAEQVGITTQSQDDGSLNIFLTSGSALVVGNSVAALSVFSDPNIANRQVIGVTTSGGGVTSTVQISASSLNGGALAGQLKFREINLVDAQNELGRLALALASAYNSVHVAGIDLTGAAGNPLFSFAAPSVAASNSNSGSGLLNVTVQTATLTQASDYRLDYNGAQFQITRLRDGVQTTAASLPVTIDGLDFAITGAPSAGDSYQIGAVRNSAASMTVLVSDPRRLAFGLSTAPGDNRNAVALAEISSQPVIGALTFPQAFGDVAAKIGSVTSGLKYAESVSAKVLDYAMSDQASVSGVNLDEEAANMIRYQQAYQASAKVIAAAQTIFQSLLELGR